MLAEILNNFAHHLLQNDFYQENNLNQMLEGLLFYLALFLIQFLLLMVLLFIQIRTIYEFNNVRILNQYFHL